MIRLLLLLTGSISLGIGVLGIFVPGLPTTIFLLGAAACYVKSSDKMYSWLLRHRIFGSYIRTYRTHRAMPFKSKVIALVMMWVMIGLSVFLFIDPLWVKMIVILAGLIGTAVIIMVKTMKN